MKWADIKVGMKLVACRPNERSLWSVKSAVERPVEVIGGRELRDVETMGSWRRFRTRKMGFLVSGDAHPRYSDPLVPNVEGQYAITNAAGWMPLDDAQTLLATLEAQEAVSDQARLARQAEEKRREKVASRAVDVLPSGVDVTDHGFRIDVDDAGFERIVTALRANGGA